MHSINLCKYGQFTQKYDNKQKDGVRINISHPIETYQSEYVSVLQFLGLGPVSVFHLIFATYLYKDPYQPYTIYLI